jgi:hypothetical protein
MGIVSLPNLGPDPFTVNASVLNGKVDPLATEFNGSIENANIAAAAAIVASKLDLSTVAQSIAMSSKQILWAKGADVASGTSIALGTDGNVFDITGTTTIQTITAKQAGSVVILHFDSALTLTDDTGNLELQGSDLTVAAEDEVILKSDGTNWHLVSSTAGSVSGILTTRGDIVIRDATSSVRLAVGSANTVLGSDGTDPSWGSLASGALPDGAVIQVVNVMDGAVATGTTAMPEDDTIPQNTEGDEYMTLAITPTATTNKLKIDVVFNCASNTDGQTTVIGLFQDSTAGALAAIADQINLSTNSEPRVMAFTHFMTAGTVSSTTFKVRAGNQSTGTTTFNGKSAGRLLGGVMASSITITEIKAS